MCTNSSFLAIIGNFAPTFRNLSADLGSFICRMREVQKLLVCPYHFGVRKSDVSKGP